MSTTKPVLCRTNLRHRWEWAHTPDGSRYVRCARCHKERESGAGGMWTAGAGMGAGGAG